MSADSLFFQKSIRDIHNCLKNKTINPIEVANACIKEYDKYEEKYHAWVVFDKKILLEGAARAKEKLVNNEEFRLLDGIPVGVKDTFNTLHFPTQMGSPLWEGHCAGNDARVVYYLKNNGAIVPGKTVTAEFAVHTLNKTINPHDDNRTPGTSSSGSAVAVALGVIPFALGTQTAASIVRPASFCGVYGCKPSFGLIPRTGTLKTTDSLDTVGYFTLHCRDLLELFNIVTVKGPNFPLSFQALNDKTRQSKPSGRPWKVAFIKTHTWDYAPDYARASILRWVEELGKDKGVVIEDVDLPHEMVNAHQIHATIYNKTLSYYFKEEAKNSKLVSPIMNELIALGNEISVDEYHEALRYQRALIMSMDDFLGKYDTILSLSTAGEAPMRMSMESPDPGLMWSMVHLPVISAPVFTSPAGLPFGLQIAARKYNDYLLFHFCEYLLQRNLIPSGPNPRVEV